MLQRAVLAACAAAFNLAQAGTATGQVMEVGADGSHWINAPAAVSLPVSAASADTAVTTQRGGGLGVPDRWRLYRVVS